ncbi:hypothetical protein GW17_00056226, partial [Ensete ventricosum]
MKPMKTNLLCSQTSVVGVVELTNKFIMLTNIVSMRSWSLIRWVETRGPALVVGCWSGGARVEWKRLGSVRSLTPARRLGQVGSRRDPSDDQVSSVVGFTILLLRIGARGFIVSVVGHSYLTFLLSLLLIMSSYLSTTPVVLTVRRAPACEGVDLTCARSTVRPLTPPYLR